MPESEQHWDLSAGRRYKSGLLDEVRYRTDQRFGPLIASNLNLNIIMSMRIINDEKAEIAFLNFINEMLDKNMSADAIAKQIDRLDFNTWPKMVFRVRSGITPKQIIKIVVYTVVGLFVLAAFNDWI